jgi:Peptidase family M23
MRTLRFSALVVIVTALTSLAIAAPALAGPPWAMVNPTNGRVSSQVGDCRPLGSCSRRHAGIDISNSVGTDVFAAYRGVAHLGSSSDAGNYITVNHANGYVTRYLHLSQFLVGEGQFVNRGQHIAEMGATGEGISGPHLHFEVRNPGCSSPSLPGVCNLNAAFPRGSTVTANTPLPMDFFLIANPAVAPYPNELAFVAGQYSDFLRRAISGGEASARIDQLWNGASSLDVIHEIYRSAEADSAIRAKARLYDAAFNRRPDNGIMTWVGKSSRSVAQAFVSSSEGKQKLPTDPTQFVKTVFLYADERAPTSNELTLYTTYVRNEGRAAGLLAISETDEHKLRTYGGTGADLAYVAMLGRAPESASLRNTWADRLNRSGAFAERDLINMILHSTEYRNRVVRIWGS